MRHSKEHCENILYDSLTKSNNIDHWLLFRLDYKSWYWEF